jgi:TetR/AcrR family transcriptional regulator
VKDIPVLEKESAQKIIIAARDEFAIAGFHGARVDQIASRAGVNKAMIYYHFHSKANLYREVINEHLSRIGEFLDRNIETENDPELIFLNIAGFFEKMFRERASFAPIFLREMASGGELIRQAFTRMISEYGLDHKLKSIIERGKKDGTFRDLDCMHTIFSFIGMNLYYMMAAPILNSVWEIKDEKAFREKRQKEVVDLFLYGLKIR